MVEATPGISLKSMLDLLPIAVAVLVGEAEEDDVGLLGEIIRLLDHVDDHLFNRALVGRHLLTDQDWRLSLERVLGLGTIELLLDVCVVIKGLNFLEEDLQVSLYLCCVFRPNVRRDILALLSRVELERLANLLVVPSIPVSETTLQEHLLLDALLLGEVDILHSLEVAAILGLKLLLDELFEALRVLEEAVVLHYLQLLALRVLRDADVLALENLGTEVTLVQVGLLPGLAATGTRACVLRDHVAQVLIDLDLGLLSLLFGIIDILKLIQVHRVQLEVGHIHLVFHLLSGLGLQIEGSCLAFGDQCVNVLVTQLVSNGEDAICSVVDHVLHLLFA